MIQRTVVFACLAVASCKSAPNNVDAAPPSEPASAPAAPPTAAPSGTAAADADCDPTCSYSAKCNRIQTSGTSRLLRPITKPDAKEVTLSQDEQRSGAGSVLGQRGATRRASTACNANASNERQHASLLRADRATRSPTADRCRRIGAKRTHRRCAGVVSRGECPPGAIPLGSIVPDVTRRLLFGVVCAPRVPARGGARPRRGGARRRPPRRGRHAGAARAEPYGRCLRALRLYLRQCLHRALASPSIALIACHGGDPRDTASSSPPPPAPAAPVSSQPPAQVFAPDAPDAVFSIRTDGELASAFPRSTPWSPGRHARSSRAPRWASSTASSRTRRLRVTDAGQDAIDGDSVFGWRRSQAVHRADGARRP